MLYKSLVVMIPVLIVLTISFGSASALSPVQTLRSGTVYPENQDNPAHIAALTEFSRVYETTDRILALDAHNGKVFAYMYNGSNGAISSKNITISSGPYIATTATFVSPIETDYTAFAIGRDTTDSRLIIVSFDASTMSVTNTFSISSATDVPLDIVQTKSHVYFLTMTNTNEVQLGIINKDLTGFNLQQAIIDNSGNAVGYTSCSLNPCFPSSHIVSYDTSPEKVFVFYHINRNTSPFEPIEVQRYDYGVGVSDLGFIKDTDAYDQTRSFEVVPLSNEMLLQVSDGSGNPGTTNVYNIPITYSPSSQPAFANIDGVNNNYIDGATQVRSLPSTISSDLDTATNSPTDPQVSCDNAAYSGYIHQSLWLQYTPSVFQLVHINMTGSNIGPRDFGYAVFAADDASTNNLKEVTCSFDQYYPSSNFDQSDNSFPVHAGVTYYIMIYYLGATFDSTLGSGHTFVINLYQDQPVTVLAHTDMHTLYPQTYQINSSTRIWNTVPVLLSDNVFNYYFDPSTGNQMPGPSIITNIDANITELSGISTSHYYFMAGHNVLIQKQDNGFKYHPGFAIGTTPGLGNYKVLAHVNVGAFIQVGQVRIDTTANHLIEQGGCILSTYDLTTFALITSAIANCDQGIEVDTVNHVILEWYTVFTGGSTFETLVSEYSETDFTTPISTLAINTAETNPNIAIHSSYDSTQHILYLLYDHCTPGDSTVLPCLYRIDTSGSLTLSATISVVIPLLGSCSCYDPSIYMTVDPVHDSLYLMDGTYGNTFDTLRKLVPASTNTTIGSIAYLPGQPEIHSMMGVDTSSNRLIIAYGGSPGDGPAALTSAYEIWDVSTYIPTFIGTGSFGGVTYSTMFSEENDRQLVIDSTRHLMVTPVSNDNDNKTGIVVNNLVTASVTGYFMANLFNGNVQTQSDLYALELDTTNHRVYASFFGPGQMQLGIGDYTTFLSGASQVTLPSNLQAAIDGNLTTSTTAGYFNGTGFSTSVEVDFGSISTLPIYARVGDYLSYTDCYACGLLISVSTSTDGSSFSFYNEDSQSHFGAEGISEHTFQDTAVPYRYALFTFKSMGIGTNYNLHFKIYELGRGDGGYNVDTLISPHFITTTQYEETLEQPLQTGLYTIYGGLLKINCGGTSYNINATFQHMIVGSDNDCTSWDIYDVGGSTLHRTVAPFVETLSAVHALPYTKIAIHLTGLTNYNDYLYRSFYNGYLVDAQHPTVNRGTVFQEYLLGQCYDTFLYQISTGLSTSLGQGCGTPTVPSPGGGGSGGTGTTGTNGGNSLVPLENVNVPSGSFGTDWPYSISRLFNSPTTGTSSVTFDFQSRAIPYNASVLVTDSWITSQQHFKQWINCSPITTQCLGVVGASNLTSVNLQTFNNRTLYFFVYDNHGIARVTAVSNGQTTQLANPFVNLGNLFGVPVLALFPVMMSLLFPKSLAPIGFAVVAAVMGYMALVGLLSLPAAVFGVIGLIAGIGLLLGVRR